jgi:hypothetical protein
LVEALIPDFQFRADLPDPDLTEVLLRLARSILRASRPSAHSSILDSMTETKVRPIADRLDQLRRNDDPLPPSKATK